ncbi:regulatory protein RecX [Butyrivibrio sp. INlla16]|uniref:regulatory protein RecX n=1 Tax=Butyrivibrio sp. INlla16 TaxID=1520807 RepID=UPI00088FCD9A|nr:regulatory protein RecX [Butyrivibrio sp. INlla16]SDB38779.1 regulatory protein [Butyrivibrio sp. INlla16]
MTVTDIVAFDNKRSKVFIDGEFAFILYRGEIRTYGIKTGEEISSPVFNEITETVIPKRAKLRAMNLLQKRDYTERKLRDKLREGMYAESVIDETIDYLKSYRYIDDERYAGDYIRYQMNLRSKNRIKQDLIQKGISADIIEKIVSEAYSEENDDPELELCISLLRKKRFDNENATYEERQKMMAFLYRKGFDGDTIQRALSLDTGIN